MDTASQTSTSAASNADMETPLQGVSSASEAQFAEQEFLQGEDVQMQDKPSPAPGPSSSSSTFTVDTSRILAIPEEEQAEELRGLGISVYNQMDLERGILDQMDQAVAEGERQKWEKELAGVRKEIEKVKQRLSCLEKTLQAGTRAQIASRIAVASFDPVRKQQEDTVAALNKLEAKERLLLTRLGLVPLEGEASDVESDGDTLDDDTMLDLERMFGHVETEEERLIRTGQMTPFGTFTKQKEPSKQSDQMQAKPTPVGKPEGHLGTSNSKELVEQEIPGLRKRKRRKKEQLGTTTSNYFSRVSNKRSAAKRSLIDEQFWQDPELSDHEDVGTSEDEYRPDPEELLDSEEDSVAMFQGEEEEAIEMTKRKKAKKRKEGDIENRQQKTAKKLADDGDYKAYLKRIKAYRHHRLREKHKKIMESTDTCIIDESDESSVEVDDDFRVPSSIWNKLYRYQQTGVRWLWELHQQNCGGIVGDEMGLGKTIQVIAFLAGLRQSRLKTVGDTYEGMGPVVLVCPTTVMHQWVREFHLWYPPIRVAILHLSGSFTGKKEALVHQLNKDNGVLITSYAGVSNCAPLLLSHNWHYIVLDEGHKIRNPDAQTTLACKQFRTTHRIILSGSPIQNNLRELWSLFDFVYPGKLGTLPVFMQQFAVPITQGGYSNATDVQVKTAYKCASVLRDTIKPYLLRRMKEDVKGHLQLPGKNEQVLFCSITEHQRQLYKDYLASPEIAHIIDGRLQIFVGLINLRKICNHPDLYDGGPKVFANTDVSSLPEESKFGHPSRSGKMAVIQSLLKLWKSQGHRVLLFTQSRQMLVILEKFIQQEGYTYLTMTGSTPIGSRQPAINKFNSDTSIFVFLLTTRVGGLGVNLTGANRVVIYDPDWNPSTDTQARERAWRIGQMRDVTVYRLLTAGTIEEKIYHRQIFKQFLTNRVLKDPKQRRFFKTNDLHELFSLVDEKMEKRTETSSIFAGTGSDIRPISKPKSKNKPNFNHRSKHKPCLKLHSDTKLRLSSVPVPHETRQEKQDSDQVNAGVQLPIGPSTPDELSPPDRESSAVRQQTSSEDRLEGQDNEMPVEVVKANEDDGPKVEMNESHVETKASLLSPEKINQMRELAKRLSQRIAQGGTGASRMEKPTKPKDEEKKRERWKKKKKKNVVDGAEIKCVVKQVAYQPAVSEEQQKELDDRQNDYVLQKLFKKSGVHSAMRHDTIMESADPDYILVEGEAERVAKEAIRKMKESRRRCLGATSGIPTWTGSHGASGAPPGTKLRFGQKKAPAAQTKPPAHTTTSSSGRSKASTCPGAFTQEVRDKQSGAPSSSDLLARIRSRNPETQEDEQATLPSTSARQGPNSEQDELLEDLRNFVAFGSATDGEATTREVLDAFTERVRTAGGAPVFKALLGQVCDFFRRTDGEGVWRLKAEFR
ncbi:DNA excision repair protein ERCC-6-like [Ornithodoros turicata]|uniref:DNA excision repair protein ERCC-6-like n=1 Tax=Ornithodoros turicata TaxID=34597 RepID=UPI00313937B1